MSNSRRNFLRSLAAAPAAWGAGRERRPPNFLIILSDDQGFHDVGCYGSEIPTPHIDSIARNGVKFTNFYAAGPVCTPSRYGLLTGCYPARSRDQLLNALMPPSNKGMHAGETTIAEVVKDRGYRTALIGKWHLGAAKPEFLPTRHGFDYFDGFVHGCIDYFKFSYGGLKSWYRNEELFQPPEGYTTDYLTDEALRFLRQNQRRPFLLYLPYNAPHYGKVGYDPATKKGQDALQAPGRYIARFANIADKNRRVYAAMVASMDDNIGRLLQGLRDLKLEEDTLVVFLSDNGGSLPYGGSNAPLRGQKADLFEGGIHVPCVMQWKGRLPRGKTIEQVAGAVDLFPTIATLAGATAQSSVDGRDLTPALFENRRFERELFWRTARADAYLAGNWKYIRTSAGEEYVFDLARDPNETDNRVAERDKLGRLRQGYLRVKATLPPPAATAVIQEDFSHGIDGWWAEGGERVSVEDGRLRVRADNPQVPGGGVATVWNRTPHPGDFELELDAHVVSSSLDANNVNLFFSYSDPAGTPLEETREARRTAGYDLYHKLNGYIVTFLNDTEGHSGKARIRIRRNPGFKLLAETFTYHCRRGVTYHLGVVKRGGEIRFSVDGKELLRASDPQPLGGGLFGLRTYRTDLWWDNVEVRPTAGTAR